MFFEDIMYISYYKYIETQFLISNMHWDLILDSFKEDTLAEALHGSPRFTQTSRAVA